MGKIYSIIKRNTEKFPKKTALIQDNGKVLSYACLVNYVDWLAARLAAVFSRGSKVFLISKDISNYKINIEYTINNLF